MADLTKNAILGTVIDGVKQTKIWEHKCYKSQIRNILKNSKFYKKKKIKMADLTKKSW